MPTEGAATASAWALGLRLGRLGLGRRELLLAVLGRRPLIRLLALVRLLSVRLLTLVRLLPVGLLWLLVAAVRRRRHGQGKSPDFPYVFTSMLSGRPYKIP
ncbi:hypothetical protein GCM10010277_51230 [Streptomyces longisporoflavus]|nr:hypothetical protein GCM10010277_51230 [Streptomyces longisporoflavus]